MKTTLLALLLLPSLSFASSDKVPVLANLRYLEKTGAAILERDEALGLGTALLTESAREKISLLAHGEGKCGGYEAIPEEAGALGLLSSLRLQAEKNRAWEVSARAETKLPKRPEILSALSELSEENLRATTVWLASYPSRYNKLPDPNVHVNDLQAKVKDILKSYPGKWQVDQISHNRTRQKSLRVRLEGDSRPAEIIVLGGHLDSINQSWGGGDHAPGADDNASGSANLLETLRVLATRGPQQRTIEFFWYAGEESGLLGSAEIAQQYKSEGKDVVAVLQLDMTMYPGSGEFVINNVSDFTSAWLRDYLVALNETYLGARMVSDACGYGCSDHASWHRQGYPALMPFESSTAKMNRKIHTDNDLVDSAVSFRHSLLFGKIALVMALDLGNSAMRQPY